MTFDIPAVFSSVDPFTCAETVLGVANNVQHFSGMAWDFTTSTMYGSTTDTVATVRWFGRNSAAVVVKKA